jgi:hypothetical protein
MFLFLLCAWMFGFVFCYLLTERMITGIFICIDTDLVCY